MIQREHKNPDDYLELVYVLSEESSKGLVRVKEISSVLKVSPSTVTEMMQRLSEKGLVIRVDYEGVRLTEMGRSSARAVLSRHRILECFFYQFLDMKPEEVAEEICGIEHHISDRVLLRLYEKLGRPKVCPHGKPIPINLEVCFD
ncbi:MAG: metal-dependent transcriptional regulator [Candidatus Verstraetearchaeota archaeon]|nr:metal-dependent transcriptional regulator [Candidatus Verstraetearchaeota archaeon]